MSIEISDIYESEFVTNAVVITSDDEECWRLAQELEDMQHTTIVVTTYHVDNERPLHLAKLRRFGRGMNNILCIGYSAWHTIKYELEDFILYSNLFVLHELHDAQRISCTQWLQDAGRRGFLNKENFLLRIIERS